MLTCELGTDQAAGLRRMVKPRPVQVIAITSGKGGVGKTNLCANLGVAMAQAGHEVMIMDADLGLANIDVVLGLQPEFNLSHVIDGERTLEEVIVQGPAGVRVVPASSGVQRMAMLTPVENAGVIRAFSDLSFSLDTLIIDTAAGISDSVVTFIRASREVVVVVCDEPASITDAYAMIKVLSRDYGIRRLHILANMSESVQHGRELYGKLLRVTQRFLDVTLNSLGAIPYDEYLQKSVRQQRAVVQAYPLSRSAAAFRKLVQKTDTWPVPNAAGGHLEFFVERLIRYSCEHQEVLS